MTSDLLALSPDVLPVPFVFVMFAMACTRQDWASAERLAGSALRRTRGSNTFWECLSLVCLTAMFCLTRTEGYNEARQLAQESIRMTARPPSQPHFHGARIAGYLILTVLCIRDRRDEEARDALRCVESLVGVDRRKSGSRIFETLCRTRPGRGWRMIALIWIAWEYNQKQSHMDAAKLLDRALAIYEGASATDQPTRPARSCFLLQRMAFWDASDMPACINTCRQLLQFLDGLPQSRVDEVNTHHRRETYKFIGWCYARLDNFNEARGAFRHAAEGVYLLDISKHKARMNDLPNLAMGLLIVGDYEKSAWTIRKTLGPDHISHKEGSLLDTDLGRLQPLADTIEQMGVFDFDHRSFIRGASLLKAAQLSAADEPSAEIDWWIDAALNLEDPPVPAFRYQRIILLLKAIDILLCDTNCAERAFFYYRDVAASLAGMGNQSASSLVTVDGASRYFTNHSESFWQGLVLLADAALYDRRFQQALLLLRAAWDVYRCDCFTDWDLLCYFVDEYVSDCEYIHKTEMAGDETARIERPFLEQACVLLAQARELSIDMHRLQIRTRIGDKKEDSSVAEEAMQSREARHAELESRLVDLEAGPLLVAARASREALATTVKKEKRRIRRVRSFAESVSDIPPVVCWRAFSRSRSLESLRGVPG
ncbi:hypothetical protein BJX66DRAFT_90959 [Aspergillus keveii]|uniref:Uncharacterized protein n=1 Tax=Aspergillus keveii TaxID=714993 RepID=A0ABR4FLW8_9EURO